MSLAAELDKLWSEVWARGRLDIPGTKVPFFLFYNLFLFDLGLTLYQERAVFGNKNGFRKAGPNPKL